MQPEFITTMQQAMLAAAGKQSLLIAAPRSAGKSNLLRHVIKALDKAHPVPQREQVKVSYRTAQKLKQEGVL